MRTYKIKCRKRILWKIYTIVGHKLHEDKMSLYFEDGSCLELAKWSRYDCQFGTDFFDVLKKQMEKQTGQVIPTNEVRK